MVLIHLILHISLHYILCPFLPSNSVNLFSLVWKLICLKDVFTIQCWFPQNCLHERGSATETQSPYSFVLILVLFLWFDYVVTCTCFPAHVKHSDDIVLATEYDFVAASLPMVFSRSPVVAVSAAESTAIRGFYAAVRDRRHSLTRAAAPLGLIDLSVSRWAHRTTAAAAPYTGRLPCSSRALLMLPTEPWPLSFWMTARVTAELRHLSYERI